MKKILLLAAAALLLGGASAGAQARKGLRINEVMVDNQTNYVDDFGQRGAWIELFNSNFAPLEISSVYLTTDPSRPTMYPVPLGDVNTRIPKRQHIIFWADNNPSRGTFHTNFALVPDRPNWIGIYDADGRTLIDSITVPPMGADQSYARRKDGVGTSAADWEVRTGSEQSVVTPSSNNIIKDTNHKVENFKEMDENGFGMTLTAMGIVFSALLLLSICFWFISRIGRRRLKRNKLESAGHDVSAITVADLPESDTGEEIAAIAMALQQHLNAHDQESAVLTINKVRRAYSPWSSHIYGMRRTPERRPQQWRR